MKRVYRILFKALCAVCVCGAAFTTAGCNTGKTENTKNPPDQIIREAPMPELPSSRDPDLLPELPTDEPTVKPEQAIAEEENTQNGETPDGVPTPPAPRPEPPKKRQPRHRMPFGKHEKQPLPNATPEEQNNQKDTAD